LLLPHAQVGLYKAVIQILVAHVTPPGEVAQERVSDSDRVFVLIDMRSPTLRAVVSSAGARQAEAAESAAQKDFKRFTHWLVVRRHL